jgi:hypothetical protein
VIASFTGPGPVDVGTSSSAIELNGVSGALTTRTASGRTTIAGDWGRPGCEVNQPQRFDPRPLSISILRYTGRR